MGAVIIIKAIVYQLNLYLKRPTNGLRSVLPKSIYIFWITQAPFLLNFRFNMNTLDARLLCKKNWFLYPLKHEENTVLLLCFQFIFLKNWVCYANSATEGHRSLSINKATQNWNSSLTKLHFTKKKKKNQLVWIDNKL